MKRTIVKKLLIAYQVFGATVFCIEFMKSRGFKKENDKKLFVDAINRINGETINDYDSIVTIDDTDLYVSYNPYMHLFANRIGSIAIILPDTTDVFTDNQFRSMSQKTQYAVLCHEIGHIKNKHAPSVTYMLERIVAIKKGKVLQMELEADEYAVSIVGKDAMIKALKELANYTHGLARKEMYLRIKYIKEM